MNRGEFLTRIFGGLAALCFWRQPTDAPYRTIEIDGLPPLWEPTIEKQREMMHHFYKPGGIWEWPSDLDPNEVWWLSPDGLYKPNPDIWES